ncbi:MAG: hypothetical protein IJ716_14455 [Lachnospiraceae bacterium]|nr:hypothetical protein [Lachnospiraceae bacterium]
MIDTLFKIIIFLGITVGYHYITLVLGAVMSTIRDEKEDMTKSMFYYYMVGWALFVFTVFIHLFL